MMDVGRHMYWCAEDESTGVGGVAVKLKRLTGRTIPENAKFTVHIVPPVLFSASSFSFDTTPSPVASTLIYVFFCSLSHSTGVQDIRKRREKAFALQSNYNGKFVACNWRGRIHGASCALHFEEHAVSPSPNV